MLKAIKDFLRHRHNWKTSYEIRGPIHKFDARPSGVFVVEKCAGCGTVKRRLYV